MGIDSRMTVDSLQQLLKGLPNVCIVKLEVVLATGVRITFGDGGGNGQV